MKVAVVGDITLNCFYYGAIKRISPEAPVPVVHVERTERSLGDAGKIITQMRDLGYEVSFYGVIGTDENGVAVCKLLQALQVDFSNALISKKHITTSRQRIIVDNHSILAIDFDEPFNLQVKEEVAIKKALLKQMQQGLDAICISSYGKGICTELVYKWIIQVTGEANIACILDPGGIPLEKIV